MQTAQTDSMQAKVWGTDPPEARKNLRTVHISEPKP